MHNALHTGVFLVATLILEIRPPVVQNFPLGPHTTHHFSFVDESLCIHHPPFAYDVQSRGLEKKLCECTLAAGGGARKRHPATRMQAMLMGRELSTAMRYELCQYTSWQSLIP